MSIKKRIYLFLSRVLIVCMIIVAIDLYCIDNNNFLLAKKYLYDSSIDYSYIKSISNKLMGVNNKNEFVYNTKFKYKSIEKIDYYYKFEVDYNVVVDNLIGGTVIFIGENLFGKSIIINGDDGVNYTYGNISNISFNLYDYVKKGKTIGNVNGNILFMSFEKNGKYLNYEEFI